MRADELDIETNFEGEEYRPASVRREFIDFPARELTTEELAELKEAEELAKLPGGYSVLRFLRKQKVMKLRAAAKTLSVGKYKFVEVWPKESPGTRYCGKYGLQKAIAKEPIVASIVQRTIAVLTSLPAKEV